MHRIVCACLFVSGAAGLTYQVLWGKYLALFIGVSGYAHTLVLATFMAGLALGNVLLGRVADRTRSPLMMYAYLEVGIGFLAALFPSLFDGLSWAYLRLASADPGSSLNLVLKLILAVLCLLPPTILMGGTLPAVVRFTVRSHGQLGPQVGLLYGVNTVGAAIGCLLAGFFFVKAFGLDASMMIGASANVAVGILLLGLRRAAFAPVNASSVGAEEGRQDESSRAMRTRSPMVVLVLLSGMVSMTLELVWIRLLSLILGSSTYSFSLMLFTFITGIACGGLIAGHLLRRRAASPLRLYGVAQIGLWVSLLVMMPLYDRVPYLFVVLDSLLSRTPEAFVVHHIVKTSVCVLLMAVPTILIGMTIPLAGAEAGGEIRVLGRTVGSVLSINTLGNVLGTLLAGFVVIPLAGLSATLVIGAVASGIVGSVAVCWTPSRIAWRRLAFAVGGIALLSLGIRAAGPRWKLEILHSGIFRLHGAHVKTYREFVTKQGCDRLEYLRDGREISVAVFRSTSDTGTLRLTVNGKPDASTSVDMATQLMLGHLPLLLHPSPSRVLTIGLGSGVTAGAVLQHTCVERQDIAELSREVVEASALFSRVNHNPLQDPRTVLHVTDAREMLLLCEPGTWDIIISEPSNPWVAGIGNLFTYEFFRACSRALRPGGMLVQWLHLYEMDDATLAVGLNTLSSVFEHVSVWSPFPKDIIALASHVPIRLDTTYVSLRAANPAVRADIAEITRTSARFPVLQILSLQVLGESRFRELYPGTGRLNRDRFPYLEYAAPKAFFLGSEGRLLLQDQRIRFGRPGFLLLSQYLADRRLTVQQLQELHSQFAWFPYGSNRHLRDVLARQICLQGAGGELWRDSTDRPRTKVIPPADDYCFRYEQVARIAQDSAWASRFERNTRDTETACTYARYLASQLMADASVFTAPDTARLAVTHQRCCDLAGADAQQCAEGRTALYRRVGVIATEECRHTAVVKSSAVPMPPGE